LTKGQRDDKPGVYFFDVPEMQQVVWEIKRCRFKENIGQTDQKEQSQKVLDKDIDCLDCASMLCQGGPVYIEGICGENYSYWSAPATLSGIEVSLSA